MDDEELKKGECISPALMKAINESRIAVVIFSENYAESHWCLEELAEIMERYKQNDLIVLPVFYNIEPREVRGPRESYGRAMAKHERKFGKDPEKLKWNEALYNAGSLSGWELNNEGNEAEFIQKIVKEISIKLDRTPLHVTEYPVGLDSRVEELKSSLSMESKDDVGMVGLWGPGGVGKTTMAKYIYNSIFREFVGSTFLTDVREKDLVSLQTQLLSEILRDKTLTFLSVDEGIALMKERLRSKNVLVVLDDVDDFQQLKMLTGARDWFGKGSLIIVTTRNKHLLTSHGINEVHEVKPLDGNVARELFCWHCFRRSQSTEISEGMIQNALHYAGGLPLALEVLGSFLCGRNEIQWESTLKKLADSPEQTINRVLKVSFDALERNEKEIFLDIACFFKGCETKYVKKVLGNCDFHVNIGIPVLIERALIREEHETLQMHGLVQSMGRDIVNQECDPNKRSRLWLYGDVQDVLEGDMGTGSIKAIVLDLPSPKEIIIHPDAFKNMKRLRLLILLSVRVSFQARICLPSELRWLGWSKYSTPAIEFRSGRNKLVGLDISNNCIRGLSVLTKQLKNLKVLNCFGCKYLVNIPDLSGSPNLEDLDLTGCKNLERVDQSVGFLSKLKNLSLLNCSKLTRFPDVLKTKSLINLSLSGCSKLEKFPEIPEQMDCWLKLYLDRTAIKEVPASIENGISLEHIGLSNCRNLTTLPSSVYNLNRLQSFQLNNCRNLIQFPKKMDDSVDPAGSSGFGQLQRLNLENCNLSEVDFLENLSCFAALQVLRLSGNKISSLPSSINKRDCLTYLFVENCDWLREIPELPPRIYRVGAHNCKSLRRVPKLLPTENDLIVDFQSCHKPLNVSDICPLEGISNQTGEVQIVVSGDEVPSWMVPVDAGHFSFSNPHLSPSKCVGLALCAVCFNEKTKDVGLEVAVSNTRRYDIWKTIHFPGYGIPQMGSDCVWFTFMPCDERLFPEWVDEADREYRVEIWWRNGVIVKKWGLRIIWKDGGDDSNTVVQHHQLTESDDETDSDEEDCWGIKEDDGDNESEADDKTDSDEENCWVSEEDNGSDDSEYQRLTKKRKM